jgi:zinc D-Ala-D-Ala carboxypeptidase
MGDLGKYFNKSEMACKCGCGEVDMDKKFMSKLDLARGMSGTSYVVNSGYRCTNYNAQVGGKPGSAHTKGLASDIKATESRKRFNIINGLIKAGFNRMGIDKKFIHVDLDTSKDKDVVWIY